jgi:hypothetical protein
MRQPRLHQPRQPFGAVLLAAPGFSGERAAPRACRRLRSALREAPVPPLVWQAAASRHKREERRR